MAGSREELMEVRKQMIAQMEQKLHESWSSEEDSLLYYHRSEGLNPCIIAIPYQGILNLGDIWDAERKD